MGSLLQLHLRNGIYQPPASPENHRVGGPKANHALTFKLGRSVGAGQIQILRGFCPQFVQADHLLKFPATSIARR